MEDAVEVVHIDTGSPEAFLPLGGNSPKSQKKKVVQSRPLDSCVLGSAAETELSKPLAFGK
ncbi:hypothetical protein K443DRAFT_684087 [Laccaria amethystina LaAM-08-1]|uniref:Uncharacterized protein n=1 Tax=Laccaria amethystina LaAM-08-1 TaxID=1095629 RepID=A0A0C9WRI9_9AGAR|nr:hypothetical protein K443DRAFT_684087 [Laccaria amethystina LaAM-08-1]